MAAEQVNQYFEGILQLRNCTEEALDFVALLIEKEKGKVWVAKEVKIKGGVDLYLSSNKFLKKAGKLLKSKFSGILKSSSKLYSQDRNTGKEIYRGTILFRMPDFKKGDEGTLKGDKVKIISIGNKIAVKDLISGRKKQYKFDDINKNFRKL